MGHSATGVGSKTDEQGGVNEGAKDYFRAGGRGAANNSKSRRSSDSLTAVEQQVSNTSKSLWAGIDWKDEEIAGDTSRLEDDMALDFEQGDFTKLDLVPPSTYDDSDTSIIFAMKANTKNVMTRKTVDDDSSARHIAADNKLCSNHHREETTDASCEVCVDTAFPFHIRSANSKWLDTFGFAEGEILGKTIRLCQGPDTNAVLFHNFIQDSANVGQKATITLYHKSGDDVVVQVCPSRSTPSCATLAMEVVSISSADDDKDQEVKGGEEMLQRFQDYSLLRAQSAQSERKSKSQDNFPLSQTEGAKSSRSGGSKYSHEAEFVDAAFMAHVRALRRSKKTSREENKESSL
eukprot:766905-Hanusia_phi.AAC.3